MEFRQLKYIYTVYECGSITKAAEKLFISQPSLSSFIAKTEKQLGVKLFDRSQNKLTLTYAGEKYIKAAERILLIYDRMIKQLEDISENRKGRLRIGIPWQRLEYMAPTLLPRLHEEFGSIEVDIVPGNYSVLEEALRNRKVDFIIVPLLKPDENYSCVEIHRENIYAVTRRGYLSSSCLVEGRRDSVDLRAIADMPGEQIPDGGRRPGHRHRSQVQRGDNKKRGPLGRVLHREPSGERGSLRDLQEGRIYQRSRKKLHKDNWGAV